MGISVSAFFLADGVASLLEDTGGLSAALVHLTPQPAMATGEGCGRAEQRNIPQLYSSSLYQTAVSGLKKR